MEKIDIKGEKASVQGILDAITGNGFWFSVSFDDGDSLTFHPYRFDVLGAKPEMGPDGAVKSWLYAVLMIDRGFADFGASMHCCHLLFVKRIEWTRNGAGRIYAAEMWDEDGDKIIINEIDAGEHPELADEWKAYIGRLDKIPDRVRGCLEAIREEFGSMVEERFR